MWLRVCVYILCPCISSDVCVINCLSFYLIHPVWCVSLCLWVKFCDFVHDSICVYLGWYTYVAVYRFVEVFTYACIYRFKLFYKYRYMYIHVCLFTKWNICVCLCVCIYICVFLRLYVL